MGPVPETPTPPNDFRFASRGQFAPQVTVRTEPREVEASEVDKAKILADAHEHFRHVLDYESEERRCWEEELRFVDELKHWTEDQKKERQGLPCLTFDKIGPKVDLVVNNMRQNPPEPRVSPVGNGADKPTAQLIQGLLRNIDNDSGAEIAWMTAYEHAAKVGRGWVRAYYDWEADGSFEAKLIIKRVSNLFSVYPDPAAEEYDYSDMRRCLVSEKMARTQFEQQYPGAMSSPWATFEGSTGDRLKEDWYPMGQVRVAEYWWIDTEVAEIYKLADGRVVTLDQMPEGAQVLRSRKQVLKSVHVAKVTGAEVLTVTDWPGKWIPIVPVLGREYVADGKRFLRGIIRAAMDANLSFDYMRSRQAQAIGLAPIAPFMVAEGQIEGHKMQWDQANRKAIPYLTYKDEVNGRQIGPPVRTNSEVQIAGITQAVAQADEDIKQTTNTFAADMGAQGPESSGRAILAKQRASDNAHFHYADNLARSIRHMGRVLIDLIPHVYSEERSIAIADPDGSTRTVQINAVTMHQGAQRIFNLADGAARYDVTIGTGPSYASRREQGKAALTEILPMLPVLAARAPDLIIKALDVPDADGFADRVRPPDVQQAADGEQQVPAAAQAQIQHLMQVVQALGAKLEESTREVQQKSLEWGAKKEIAALQGQVDILRAEISAKGAEMQTLAQLDHAAVKHVLDLEAAEGQAQQAAQQQGQQAAGNPGSSPNPPAGFRRMFLGYRSLRPVVDLIISDLICSALLPAGAQ